MDVTWCNVLLACFIAYVSLSLIKRIRKKAYKLPPGPPRLPIIGNALNFDANQPHKSLWDHREKYGEMSSISIGGNDILVLNTLEAVQEAAPLLKNRPYTFFGDYVLENDIVFHKYDDDWHKFRSSTQEGFLSSIQNSKEATAAHNEEFKHLKSAFLEKKDESFDPSDILQISWTCSLIVSLIGRRLDYDHEVFALYLDYKNQCKLLLTNAARLITDMFPSVRYLPFWYGAYFGRIKEIKATLAEHLFYNLKRQSEIETKSGVIFDLLRAQKKYPESIEDKNIEAFLLDVHTAANVGAPSNVRAIIYNLLHHPRAQKEIYREIVAIIGKTETPLAEHEAKMPYTQAVILETVRLLSVVPEGVPRCPLEDINILGYDIPKHAMVLANIWRINHDEELWEDPGKFKPERFLDHSGNLLPKDHVTREALIAFGMPLRRCLGKDFALSLIFLYVANLCQMFQIYQDPGELGSKPDPRDYPRIFGLMYVPDYTIRVKKRL